MSNISPTAIIHPNVILHEGTTVEDYCVIGLPFKGMKNDETIIGKNSIIRAGSYIYAGNKIGKNFQTGNKVNIREKNIIQDNVSIGTLSVVEHNIQIGSGVRIHSQVFIPEFTILEDECWLGPNVVITNAKYPKHPSVKDQLKGAHIHKSAKIGANTTLLPGISIGENSLIGAGSLVTHDISSGVVAFGNPAKILRKIDY